MKRFALSIIGIFLLSAASAQESYTIRMELLVEGLPEEYAAFADQDIVTQIKGTMSRTEVNGMLYTSLVFFRNDTLTTLNDAMRNKSGFSASRLASS